MTWNGKVISVDPPTTVELEVASTDPGVKGNTVSGGSKPATLETGRRGAGPPVRERGREGQGGHEDGPVPFEGRDVELLKKRNFFFLPASRKISTSLFFFQLPSLHFNFLTPEQERARNAILFFPPPPPPWVLCNSSHFSFLILKEEEEKKKERERERTFPIRKRPRKKKRQEKITSGNKKDDF